MTKKLPVALLLFATGFLISGNQSIVFVNSQVIKNKGNIRKKESPGCSDLADFNYEIFLGLSSFPPHARCNDKEERGISSFLEERINAVLKQIPGTIETKNKICNNPIDHRRRLLNNNNNGNETMNNSQESTNINGRKLYRRRSYIYVGGGKCRYCLKDNFDHRALFSEGIANHNEHNSNNGRNNKEFNRARDLMFLSLPKRRDPPRRVADISLCKKLLTVPFRINDKHPGLVKWTNAKKKHYVFKTVTNIGKFDEMDAMGPYTAGETFGFHLNDFNNTLHTWNHARQQVVRRHRRNKDTILTKFPVKGMTFYFWFYAFDLPTDVAKGGMLADDPFYLFINGIKLDFNLFLSQPKDTGTTISSDSAHGTSLFAGIHWHAELKREDDIAYGPEVDRMYVFTVTAPLLVFENKNELDIDFIIKPTARAKRYAFNHFHPTFMAAACEVTGMENSRFGEFQSVVESRLFHKLGIDLARKFQGKKGHCLYDTIPMVDVHLVEKTTWKESNPRCG